MERAFERAKRRLHLGSTTQELQLLFCHERHGALHCFTCHDDVQFVADLHEAVSELLCVDEDNVFATGASNGAMFLYSMLPAMADRNLRPRFKAIVPHYGSAFEHMEHVVHPVAGTAVFAHHGIYDPAIPPDGGESYDHWLYIPVDRVLQGFASANECSLTREEVKTPWHKQGRLIDCHQYRACHESPVVRCNYNASHGFWENFQVDLLWWQVSGLISSHNDVAVVV